VNALFELDVFLTDNINFDQDVWALLQERYFYFIIIFLHVFYTFYVFSAVKITIVLFG